MDLNKYRQLFIDEAGQHIDALAVELAGGPPFPREAVDSLFRHAHSLKGMSASMQIDEMRGLAHLLEDSLARIRDDRATLETASRDRLLLAVDILADQLTAYGDGRPLQRVEALPIGPPAVSDTAVDTDEPSVVSTPAVIGTSATGASAGERTDDRSRTLRVEAALADRMQERLTDLILNWSGLQGELSESHEHLRRRLRVVQRTLDDLNADTMAMRLVRLDSLAAQLRRTARETAGQLGKQVEFTFRGADVALDRGIVDTLADPLIHLIRNAIDHGIEERSARLAAGKSGSGSLVLTAERQTDSVYVSLSDDGRGIDPGRLAERARAVGYDVDPTASTNDLLLLATLPGLTTATTVSEISGRGVGLDLVRSAIEGLGGRLQIDSDIGKGTTFTLRAPLTLALQRLFVARIGEVSFALPRPRLLRVLELSPTDLDHEQGLAHYELDGDRLSCVDLATALGVASDPRPDDGRLTAVVVQTHVGRWLLLIDEVVAELELVVRPLGRPLQRMPQFSAAALRPDGRILLVLDVEGIAAGARARIRQPGQPIEPELPSTDTVDESMF